MVATAQREEFAVGDRVEVQNRWWDGGYRIAALTDGRSVWVEKDCELPAVDVRLVLATQVRKVK